MENRTKVYQILHSVCFITFCFLSEFRMFFVFDRFWIIYCLIYVHFRFMYFRLVVVVTYMYFRLVIFMNILIGFTFLFCSIFMILRKKKLICCDIQYMLLLIPTRYNTLKINLIIIIFFIS